MVLGDAVLSRRGGDYWCLELLREGDDLVGRVAVVDAPSDYYDGPPGPEHQLHRPRNGFPVGRRRRGREPLLGPRGTIPFTDVGLEDVARDVDERRAGTGESEHQ